ncbi:hypothetical protein M997_3190 [Proteus hauseri ATCC 700826]|uniref:Uncharacterized protein n=1 Tax=Proteus hauseri ATCC 700826 TaxID=1354271 RepID=A0AAJ3HPY5_PROHU|nr:hypothetical protein [Proteus hauseri]OAT45158.1 hypothetical protein M997_3190 [Proteus hauseri ATCC 700826]
MKNINIEKSAYINQNANVFVVNDNAKLMAMGAEPEPAYVYSQSNNSEIVCFEERAQIYGDSSEVIYENPAEFTPTTNNKFVTFAENTIICPGNKSVNCAFGNGAIFYTGYELLKGQELTHKTNSYNDYKFLENSICFSSGSDSTIYTSPSNYCVINAKLITTGNYSRIDDYSPASNNIILSMGDKNRVGSKGCRALLSTGDNVYARIENAALSEKVNYLVEKQEIICLGKESRVSTDNKSIVVVKEDMEWVKVGIKSILAVITMINDRPDILLFYTENEENEYPANIADAQKINSGWYYKLNENKELVKVNNPNYQP